MLDRIEAHVVAYQIAPHQNSMVTIMIPQIRFFDRPLMLVVRQPAPLALVFSDADLW
jgi:hypothetical protein